MADAPTLDELIARTRNLPARVLPDAVSGREIAETRRALLAKRFAQLCVEHGFDEVKAYAAMEAAIHIKARRPLRNNGRTSVRTLRMVRRWLVLALPEIKVLIEQSQDRAGSTLDAAMQFLKTVLLTNPTTFLEETTTGSGKYRFQPYQVQVTDQQRAVITKMKLDPETGTIVDISTPDPTRAVEQLLRLLELKNAGKGAMGAGDSVAKRISERFEKVKLMKIDPRKKPVLVAAAAAVNAARR